MAINQIPTGAIQDSAVISEKIGNSEVAAADLATDAVTTNKIADQSVTSDKIDDTVASKGSSIALSIALG